MPAETSRPRHSPWLFSARGSQLLPLVVPGAVLIIWTVVAASGWVRPVLLPRPEQVLEALSDMASTGELYTHIVASVQRISLGFFIGALLGVAVGIATGYFETLRHLLRGPIRFLRAIPIYAWIPMLILWFGIGEASKIIAITMGVFFPVHLNTEDGINNTDRRFLEVAALLQLRNHEVIRKVIVPGALPFIFAGLRLGVSRACMVVVVAELIAATSGLGFLISDARLLFRPDIMIVGMVTIGIVGIVFDQAIGMIESRMLRWSVRLRQ